MNHQDESKIFFYILYIRILIIILFNSLTDADHVLFGLVLGILSGLFLVLVIFSIMFVFFVRKQKIVPTQELIMIGDTVSNTDNNTSINTLDDPNHETNTETTTTERNASQMEFNPLLIVNPVKKPPRLGIPDVSSSDIFKSIVDIKSNEYIDTE
ncbi:hypothetical protein BLA29_010689 [Euroglyphus maynei]|uniref:Uncharacterized protein n=1 Tax=Euroglyphus maynei TaxID=6958 RepID=A0A1Y3ARG1_EURMA|nr:hypothetical protein BLA29_010689 [Euroglyphus maynei]